MRNVRFALRQLAAAPGFTTLAVLTLALGIGLNTAMFSILNTFLLRPPPYPEPHRLFRLDRTSAQQPDGAHPSPNYPELQRHSVEVAKIAAYVDWGFILAEPGRPAEMRSALRVSSGFLDLLGVQPALGRDFRTEEDAPGRNHVVIISHNLWQSRFGADAKVIGRVVRIDGTPTEIVGVLPESASAPGVIGPTEMLRPIGFTGEERSSYSALLIRIVGRYARDVTPGAAQAHFDVVATRLAADHPRENTGYRLRTVSIQSTILSGAGVTITYMLLGLSGFVLLIACANLANLLVARAISRAREFAIRAALGASSSQLIRPLLAECLLVAAAGGAAGVQLSLWTTEWIARRLSGPDGPPLEFTLDWRVLTFAMSAALVTAVLFGVGPAWLVSHVRVNDTLKSSTRGSTSDRSHNRIRHALIVGQFALALVLLAGAASFVAGVSQALARQTGWNPGPLVTGKLALPTALASDPDRTFRFYQQARDRLAALPGAENAAMSLDLPLFGFPGPRGYIVEGRDRPPAGHEPTAFTNAVMPQYFATVSTPVLRGRGIVATDTRESARVVVINETMARALFPRGDAIGQRLGRAGEADPEWAEIVGIARDVEFLTIAALPTTFQVYKPLSQETWGYVSVTLRAKDANAAALVDPLRRVVSELNPDLPVIGLMTVPALIRTSNRDLATINQLLMGFAGLGLFLAALGIYGVIARLVTQRTTEIGIRMALGAGLADVVRLVLGSGFRLTIVGAGLGVLGAIALTRAIGTTMPGLATDATLLIIAAVAVLLVVSMGACYLPARRAARVDPVIAMRTE
jgi:putative ABC transport system permease protein